MKILEVSRYKNNFADHQLPFVTEQGQSLQAAGCQVEYFLVRGNYIKAVGALKAKIREFKPDIVHAHYGLSGITAALAKLFSSSFSLVITFHNGEWHNWWVNMLSSFFALRAKHLIYVAPHIREKMFIKHPHYTILPCGVNMEESKPTDYQQARTQLGFDPDTYYILFGGAFSNTRKNVALLREAVELLENKNRENTPKIEKIGIGASAEPEKNISSSEADASIASVNLNACDSPREQALGCSYLPSDSTLTGSTYNAEIQNCSVPSEHKIADSPLSLHKIIEHPEGRICYPELNIEIIEMKGMDRKTVALYMSACDLFALPTKNEGSPQALKEAMVCNCPIVATDCADIAHLLGDLEGHYLLTNKGKSKAEWVGDDNSIEELRVKIEEAMQLPRGFRTKGRERIIELGYTNELVAEKLVEIYKDILTKN